MSRKPIFGVVLSLAVVFGAAAVAHASATDAWITTKAKIAMMTTDGVSATAVNVDTVDGKVTIHGKVKTEQEKSKAETVVKQIDGVKEVKNLLQVVPAWEKDLVKATDKDIESSLKRTLKNDKTLEGVAVASVNNGVVLLSGNVPDLKTKLHAIELAAGTPGVKRVSSEIKATES